MIIVIMTVIKKEKKKTVKKKKKGQLEWSSYVDGKSSGFVRIDWWRSSKELRKK